MDQRNFHQTGNMIFLSGEELEYLIEKGRFCFIFALKITLIIVYLSNGEKRITFEDCYQYFS